MTGTWAHVTKGRVSLVGDSRGILVDHKLREAVWSWAEQLKINIEYQGSMSGKDLWYVKDDRHRNWFTLRWGQ